jgi:hypothetical protein
MGANQFKTTGEKELLMGIRYLKNSSGNRQMTINKVSSVLRFFFECAAFPKY